MNYKAKILIIICIIASIEAKAQNENILIGLNSPAYGVSIKTNFNSTGLAGWARGFSISNEDLTEKFISFSAKGTTDQNGSSFDYGYIGRKYNDTFMVFRPNICEAISSIPCPRSPPSNTYESSIVSSIGSMFIP